MNRDDERQLDAVLEAVTRAFEDRIVGVYQYGSAVRGGLRRFSDLDVLVVVDRPTTYEQRQQLVGDLMAVSGKNGTRIAGRPVEVTVVLQSMVMPWRPDKEREFQYGEWLRRKYGTGYVPDPQVDPDLAPLLATALTASIALVGPPAREVIAPTPQQDLVAAMRQAIPALIADLDSDTTNVLLTLARIWHTKEEGTMVPKDVAASWALDRLPQDLRPPLEHARAVYLGEQDNSYERLRTAAAATAEHLRARCWPGSGPFMS